MAGVDIFPDEESGNIYKRYSNRIFNCSAIGANAIRKINADGLSSDAWVSILFEFLFFYVALTAETGLIESDIERRERVITKLSQLVIPAAVEYLLDDSNDKTRNHLLGECAGRLQEYAKYDQFLPFDGEERHRHSALGAFCHRVAELAGHPGDSAHVMTCHAHVQDSLELLNLDLFAAMA